MTYQGSEYFWVYIKSLAFKMVDFYEKYDVIHGQFPQPHYQQEEV